ncbi:hypothetical protein DV711_05330 [Motiliproteus coralliicola]|uniref:Uncharacterized protein n=1 Tax=Motiliproteus coralliicola TaxID=2283196 RepID=A0A369WV41_9GAMM|nr:DUF6639 family protein [Motiliproteus coralliicola]RDE24993.1 hypothetical protein DV711_05330 [Motiliproteus coralliicola]
MDIQSRRIRDCLIVGLMVGGLFGSLVGTSAASAQDAVDSCPDGRIQLLSAVSDRDKSLICVAALQSLQFLQRLNLPFDGTIRIEVVEQPMAYLGHALYGSYDARQDLIRVMSSAAISAQQPDALIYHQPFESGLYRSVVAHEVAHAVVKRHAPELNRTAQEYLAHATQLAVLPQVLRQRIIQQADVQPWQRDDVISDIYMAMALTKFAVKCYLHLSRHPQPTILVQQLLSSKWRYIVVM